MTLLLEAGPQARATPRDSPARLVRAANRQAFAITGRPHLSHSQLHLMRTCPRKFAYTYVEKAPPAFVPATLLFGGSIHAALELHYRCRLEALTATPEALLSAYHDNWHRELQRDGDVPVRFNKDDDENTLAALADRVLRAFLASPLATPKGVILGVEEELRVELATDVPDLLARVDLVTMTDGSLFVIDFKTSRSRWTEEKALESGDQLVLYGRTVEELGRTLGLPVKLHFAIITKAKKPVIQLLPVPTDPTRVATLTESVSQVWRAIQTGNFYPSPSPQNCTSCPFRDRCPVFAG